MIVLWEHFLRLQQLVYWGEFLLVKLKCLRTKENDIACLNDKACWGIVITTILNHINVFD